MGVDMSEDATTTVPIEKRDTAAAFDGRKFEKKWIESGRDPGWLGRFLGEYPAAFHLSWVKEEVARWGARSEFDNLKLLQPQRGKRKFDTGLRQVYIDFLVYQAVDEMLRQGYPLTSEKRDTSAKQKGIFDILSKTKRFAGDLFTWTQIRDRYYRFLNHQAVFFIDDGKKMIFGPGRISFEINGEPVSFIGIAEYEPKDGFELINPE
jgi:hypothetical protein